VDTHGSDVVVDELVDVLVEVLLVLEVIVEVDVVVGMTTGSGSPQWASEQEGFFSSISTSCTMQVLEGSAQCEYGRTRRLQSVGSSQRGSCGSAHRHPAKTVRSPMSPRKL
jgi:hypothetical protein